MSRARSPEEVAALYSRRTRSYVAYVQAFRHRQGLRAVMQAGPLPGAGGRVLDAGCGTGLSILAVKEAAERRGEGRPHIQGFDLTPAMLDACRVTLQAHGLADVELRLADICRLDGQLPASWSRYDLIVCASVLEHLAPRAVPDALAALRRRLAPDGRLLLVISRKSFYPTRWIWHCAGYRRRELNDALAGAGFGSTDHRGYPLRYAWLNVGSHVVEAAR